MSDFQWDKEKPTYQSKYQNTIDNLLNKITNRENFSYDFNADPLYQQYKDQYTKLGNEAAMNAAANLSSLTGGYGNSYAATAASQANQQYLTQLNNVIPELANAALNKYKMETENLYNQFGAVGNAEDRAYGQYRDTVSDYYADRDFAYGQYRDDVSDNQWREQFDYNKYLNDRNFAYQQNRDTVADNQWREQFDTSKNQWDKTFNYQQERDKVSDDQWEKNYALSQASHAASASNAAASLAWQKEKYYNDLALAQQAKDEEAAKNAKLYGTATDEEFAKYKDFVTTHGMDDQQVRDYLERLYNNLSIDEDQLKSLARWGKIKLN